MEKAIEIQVSPGTRNEGRLVDGKDSARARNLQRPSIVEWYRILRGHYHWAWFEAIRYALWLAR
jgi:hypothetical protein